MALKKLEYFCFSGSFLSASVDRKVTAAPFSSIRSVQSITVISRLQPLTEPGTQPSQIILWHIYHVCRQISGRWALLPRCRSSRTVDWTEPGTASAHLQRRHPGLSADVRKRWPELQEKKPCLFLVLEFKKGNGWLLVIGVLPLGIHSWPWCVAHSVSSADSGRWFRCRMRGRDLKRCLPSNLSEPLCSLAVQTKTKKTWYQINDVGRITRCRITWLNTLDEIKVGLVIW